jgi:hypothetical protein
MIGQSKSEAQDDRKRGESPSDPRQPLPESVEPYPRSSPSDPGEQASPAAGRRKRSATGEHPAVRSTAQEDQVLPMVNPGAEEMSLPLPSYEPEDNWPDHLDKNK